MRFINCGVIRELGIDFTPCCGSCHEDKEDGYDDEMCGIYLDDVDLGVKWEDGRLVGSLCCAVNNEVDWESEDVKKKLLKYLRGNA